MIPCEVLSSSVWCLQLIHLRCQVYPLWGLQCTHSESHCSSTLKPMAHSLWHPQFNVVKLTCHCYEANSWVFHSLPIVISQNGKDQQGNWQKNTEKAVGKKGTLTVGGIAAWFSHRGNQSGEVLRINTPYNPVIPHCDAQRTWIKKHLFNHAHCGFLQ